MIQLQDGLYGAVATGFAAGMLHVVAGPDHIAALAPLAVRNRAHAMRTGSTWGAGHGTGVLILGGVGIWFKQHLDIDFLSRWSEVFVGFLLIGIGLWAARQTYVLHKQGFGRDWTAGKLEAGNLSEKENKLQQREEAALAPRQHALAAAFGVGVLHGAAGTGHLFGVLPSLALPPLQAASYLISYLVAAVLAMTGVGFMLGSIGDYGGPKMILRMMGISSLVAIGVGILWMT
mmetsp:Transcript_24858/g.54166  ORF Transcript_24858/g.54166 Transcript_24858/m.54166 type:complete len:232 (+) Transcript_24858:212-907(+)|eukprot:CAMPEP_0118942360 /NCGR_PEP_ID=MMETSP1169-20130426/36031_1 /TAXON_ID=36882 /ORGANISM="Pyramimonas obovata, Strain CCMP722" /LENGTH=231 /DNA_ID=CAMNT_0006887367 /DNA_START=199 /DNA_END=894 /DNA_ORIENTATION=+